MDITLRGLIPDRNYSLSARATAGAESSDWSPLFRFRSGTDKTAPSAPSNFTVVASGSTYQASWEKPTTNEDGSSPVRDFKGYIITVNVPGATKIMTRQTVDTGFVLNYWDIVDFFGSWQPALEYRAYSVDLTGNISLTPAFVAASKPPPLPVTGLTWVSRGDAFVASWTAPVHPDIMDYEVTVTNGTRSERYYITTTTFDFTKAENIAAFSGYKTTVDISVRVRDSAKQTSTPVTATASKAVPAAPTGLTWVVDGTSFKASWLPVTTNSTGAPLDDLSGYRIRLVAGTVERFEFVTGESFNLTQEYNRALFGTPQGSIAIYVAAMDSVRQTGAEATATATRPAPAAPTLAGTTAGQTSDSILLTWNAIAGATHYEIWSYTGTNAATLHSTVAAGSTAYTYTSTNYGVQHNFYLRTVDAFNTPSVNSNVVSYTPTSQFVVDTTPPPAGTLSAATAPANESIPARVALTWTQPATTDLAGFQIRYTLTPLDGASWNFIDISDPARTSHTVANLESAKTYYFEMRPYDKDINFGAWSNQASAVSSTSNIQPTSITSDIQVISGGVLRSSDYDATLGNGWRLSATGLDIQNGSVNARVIRAGELRSTATTTADGTTQPTWSLNLAGNASLNDVRVRGKIIVGMDPAAQAGINNAGVAVQSWNYGGAGSQWAIRGDGTFDIKSGTGTRIQLSNAGLEGWAGTIKTFGISSTDGSAYFKGEIQAESGSINKTLSVIGQLEVGGSASSYIIARKPGAAGTWVMLDGRNDNGNAISSSGGTFNVTYEGVLFARGADIGGTIRAGAGDIGGWSIHTNRITNSAGTVHLWNDGHIQGAKVTAGTLVGNTFHSTNLPGSANSWRLADGGLEIWNGAATPQRTILLRNDGYAEFRNVYVYGAVDATSGTFSGTVNASGGNFTGNITGGDFRGGYFRTGAAGSGVEIGPALGYYGGPGPTIALGGRVTFSQYDGMHLKIHNYDALALTQFEIHATGSMRFASADGWSGNSFVSVWYTDSRGLFMDRSLVMNSTRLYFRQHGDDNHYIGWASAYDGPMIHGYNNVSLHTNWGRVAYADHNGDFRVNSLYVAGHKLTMTAAKSFVIQHPKKKTKYLVHAAIEGPSADVYYRGKAQLVNDVAHVELPEYFESLTVPKSATITVTPIIGCENDSCDNPWAPTLAVTPVRGNKFSVIPQGGFSHPCASFYWEVKATRADIEQFEVEPSKSDYDLHGDGPYTYLTKKS